MPGKPSKSTAFYNLESVDLCMTALGTDFVCLSACNKINIPVVFEEVKAFVCL